MLLLTILFSSSLKHLNLCPDYRKCGVQVRCSWEQVQEPTWCMGKWKLIIPVTHVLCLVTETDTMIQMRRSALHCCLETDEQDSHFLRKADAYNLLLWTPAHSLASYLHSTGLSSLGHGFKKEQWGNLQQKKQGAIDDHLRKTSKCM